MSAPTLSRPSAYRTDRSRPASLVPASHSGQAQARIVVPDLRIAAGAAGSVFRVAAARGPVSRDLVAKATGLSIATVNRQVTALLAAGLLRERADLTESGAIGRPRIPVEVDHEQFLTVGIHIGAVTTGIVAADLRGRIIGAVEIPTPSGDQHTVLASITASARAFVSRWHRRTALWAGVALGGRVDSRTGVVDHPRLGWSQARVGETVSLGLRLPVSVAAHVEAMAAAELLLTPNKSSVDVTGAGLYIYARETAGVAITFDGKVHTPTTGPGSISHLPTGSSVRCACGGTGCLEATISDQAVIERARSEGVLTGSDQSIRSLYGVAREGSEAARAILVDRASTLGWTVAILRDLFNPDRVVLGGQAFTEYPEGITHVVKAFERASSLPRRDVHITGFGNGVQAHAAGVVSLSSLYSDPLGVMRRVAT